MIDKQGFENLLVNVKSAAGDIRAVHARFSAGGFTNFAPLEMALVRLSWIEGYLEGAATAPSPRREDDW